MPIHRRMLLAQAFLVGLVNLALTRSAAAQAVHYTYDALGRVKTVTYADSTSVTYSYDAAGNRTQVLVGDAPPPPPPPPPGFNQTIQITGTGPVNLRALANGAGYTGLTNATITFQVGSGVTVIGTAGTSVANGGHCIDTGAWPSGSYAIALTLEVSGKAYGGGGGGGVGAGSGLGSVGRFGGDALYCQENLTVLVNAGGELKAGGGGGGGGGSWSRTSIGTTTWNGGGGGGGFPNGQGGAEGTANNDVSNPGAAGTISGGGTGGTAGACAPTAATRINGAGGAGGAAGAAGATGASASGSGGLGTWTAKTPGAGGQAGYAVRKNGKTVSVTNNGTVTGTVG